MFKRLISLILALFTVFAVGCADTSDDTSELVKVSSEASQNESSIAEEIREEEPKFDTAPRKLEFTSYKMWCSMDGLYADESGITYILRTKAELEALLSLLGKSEFPEQLDEDFFDTKALLMAHAASGTNCTEVVVNSVGIDENGITMTLYYTIYGGDTGILSQAIFAAVDKDEIEGCDKLTAKIDYRTCPVDGIDSVYDPTPRDIPYTQYAFSRAFYEDYIMPITSIDDFGINLITDESRICWLPESTYAYTDIDDGFEKYCSKFEYGYLDDKSVLVSYAMSDNPKSYFEISAIKADENGITVTLDHKHDESLNGEKQTQIIMVEVYNEYLSGCDNFNLVINDIAGNLAPPVSSEPEIPVGSDDPCPEIGADGITPEGYGTEITEESEYIGLSLYPFYASSGIANIELQLFNSNYEIISTTVTNNQGFGRFVGELGERYYIAFAGNDEYLPNGYIENGDEEPYLFLEEYSSILLNKPMENATVNTVNTIIQKRGAAGQVELQFVDADTNEPIPYAYIDGITPIVSDENGILKVNSGHFAIFDVAADGYYMRDFSDIAIKRKFTVPLEKIEYTDINVKVTDKESGEPINGARVIFDVYNINVDSIIEYTDENGQVSFTTETKFFEEERYLQLRVYIKDRFAYVKCPVTEDRTDYEFEIGFGDAQLKK